MIIVDMFIGPWWYNGSEIEFVIIDPPEELIGDG